MTVAPSISELDVRALWHPLTQHKPLTDSPPPLMVRGEGCYLEDEQGRRYLDAMAGLWCVNIGYGRSELAATAAAQMTELAYL
ncbi:MAG: aspartate aminotransferase family protein, partial [Caldilineaceae bacterium SB0665_bin_25]|nr:aspartate aminotransferase family protein [Caldilineaceae bacterium SB0665_bin_25]